MAASRFARSHPEVTGRSWALEVTECADGRLAVSGLPEDRELRLSLTMRLRDILTATAHTDGQGEPDAALWRRYALEQYDLLRGEITVEYVPASD